MTDSVSHRLMQFYRVEVSDDKGQVVAIGNRMLAGRDIGPDELQAIQTAIDHLCAFSGLRPSADALTPLLTSREGPEQALSESDIVINGRRLVPSEATTLRVALESFASDLSSQGLGDDETGKAICAGYLRNIGTIRETLYRPSAREFPNGAR